MDRAHRGGIEGGYHEPIVDWPYDPESDLARITRDHTFLRILTSSAESEGLANPLKLNAFLGAIINQITIDPGLKSQLIPLVTHYRHLNSATVPETTLPVTQVGGATGYSYLAASIGDVDFPVEPADDQTIAAWDGSALPTPAAPTSVDVDNITDTSLLAAHTALALTADGEHISGTGDGTIPAATSETLVEYPPGDLAQAMSVMSHLSGAVMLDADSQIAAGTVSLQVGSTVSVIPPAAPAASAPAKPAAVAAPSPGGQKPSSSADQLESWDPRACPA